MRFWHGWLLNAGAWNGRMLFLAQHGCRVIGYNRRSLRSGVQEHTETGETGLSYQLPDEDPDADLDRHGVWARKDLVMKAFSIVAALATAVQAGALIMLHLLPTGYNPVRDAVSDYGVGPYRGWFWLQAVAGGVGCLALGIALAQLHPFTPTQVVIALIVTAASRFLIPFFATDQHGNRFQTLHGTIHMILAVIAFGGLVWAATGLWSTLRHYPAWNGAEGALTTIPWIMLGSVVAVVLAIRGPRLKPVFGIFERLFYLSSITWLLIVAIDLARISG